MSVPSAMLKSMDRVSEAQPKNRLRQWRLRNRLSLRDLEDLTGYSAGFLSRVERGEKAISPLSRVKLARLLGVRPAVLFDPDARPLPPKDEDNDGAGDAA